MSNTKQSGDKGVLTHRKYKPMRIGMLLALLDERIAYLQGQVLVKEGFIRRLRLKEGKTYLKPDIIEIHRYFDRQSSRTLGQGGGNKFLSLPTEIRMKIYKECVRNEENEESKGYWPAPRERGYVASWVHRRMQPAFMRASMQMRYEGGEAFFGKKSGIHLNFVRDVYTVQEAADLTKQFLKDIYAFEQHIRVLTVSWPYQAIGDFKNVG